MLDPNALPNQLIPDLSAYPSQDVSTAPAATSFNEPVVKQVRDLCFI